MKNEKRKITNITCLITKTQIKKKWNNKKFIQQQIKKQQPQIKKGIKKHK